MILCVGNMQIKICNIMYWNIIDIPFVVYLYDIIAYKNMNRYALIYNIQKNYFGIQI